MKTVERDPAGGWIARDPATGKEIEEGWRWNTRESARDAVWQFQNLPPAPGVGVVQPRLSDERILHLWDTHVAYETNPDRPKQPPLGNKDKLAFARAVLAAAGVKVMEAGPQTVTQAVTAAIARGVKVAPEIVAWMWQHEETGNTGFVDHWQVENGWQIANPRLKLVRALVFATDGVTVLDHQSFSPSTTDDSGIGHE